MADLRQKRTFTFVSTPTRATYQLATDLDDMLKMLLAAAKLEIFDMLTRGSVSTCQTSQKRSCPDESVTLMMETSSVYRNASAEPSFSSCSSFWA